MVREVSSSGHLVKLTGCWQSQRKPNQSLKASLTGYCHDHDVVILPFARLAARWRCKHGIPETLPTVLRTESSPRKSLRYRLKAENTCLVDDPFRPIHGKSLQSIGADQWCIDTAAFLDMNLDNFSGKFCRFSRWFEDGNCWESAYEERLLPNYSANPGAILKHDPYLSKALQRRRLLILMLMY